jgi:hypothetical protein
LNSEFFRALILELSIHQSGSGFVADPLQLFTFSSKMAGMLGIQFVDRIRLRKLFRCKNCGIVFSFAKPLWYRKVRQATRPLFWCARDDHAADFCCAISDCYPRQTGGAERTSAEGNQMPKVIFAGAPLSP